VTIVLSTHDMEEADRLCDRIAIMDHGRIVAPDTPEALKRLIPGGTRLELRARLPERVHVPATPIDATYSSPDDPILVALEQLTGVTRVDRCDGRSQEDHELPASAYRLYADGQDAGTLLASAAQAVISEQAELLDLRLARPSLEDVFIYLTGSNLRS